MNIDKFKSIALSLDCYHKLQELSLSRFEMPVSMASVVRFFINKAYTSFIESVNEKHANECWELIKDFEPSTPLLPTTSIYDVDCKLK
jgi:endo-1,4-beta-mannosidase